MCKNNRWLDSQVVARTAAAVGEEAVGVAAVAAAVGRAVDSVVVEKVGKRW